MQVEAVEHHDASNFPASLTAARKFDDSQCLGEHDAVKDAIAAAQFHYSSSNSAAEGTVSD